MSAASGSWEVPGGFTNTGLCAVDNTLAIGDYTNGKIVFADIYGRSLGGDITLESSPASSVQGVAYDSSDGSWWVCHYAATNGTIRRYNASGALLQTLSPGLSVAGPNGCWYDAANDRILTAWNDDDLRGFDCADGSLDETITLAAGWIGADTADGVTVDPDDSAKLWVTAGNNKIAKVVRATGAVDTSFIGNDDIESLAFVGGYLYINHDSLYHSNITDGNRVYRYDVTAQKPVSLWIPWGKR